MINSI